MMQLPQASYDTAAVALMGRVCDEAWREIQVTSFFPTAGQSAEVRRQMALRVLDAVAAGERDFDRLKSMALSAIHG